MEAVGEWCEGRPNDSVSGDFDSDGFPDMAMVSTSGSNAIFRIGKSTEKDCWGDAAITLPQGAFGFIGNSGDGYGVEAYFSYNKYFWDAVFSNSFYRVGEALNDTKNDNIGMAQINARARDAHFKLNLFGDPATELNFPHIPYPINKCDYDGDGTSDFGVFQPFNASGPSWQAKDLWNNDIMQDIVFGVQTDIPASGDYNGDGITDLAVYKKYPNASGKNWLVDTNRDGGADIQIAFETSHPETDYPVPADYNGDGTTDYSCFNPISGDWRIRNITIIHYGVDHNLDIPLPGDYNGDGSDDFAFYVPSSGNWLIDLNLSGVFDIQKHYGGYRNIPIPSDYNGDGITDIAVIDYYDKEWKIQDFPAWSFNTDIEMRDIPAPADYDGDGSSDMAVFRPSFATQFDAVWIIQTGNEDYIIRNLGDYSDLPVSKQP